MKQLGVIVLAFAGVATAGPARSEGGLPAAAGLTPQDQSNIAGSVPSNQDEITGLVFGNEGGFMFVGEGGGEPSVPGIGPGPDELALQPVEEPIDLRMGVRGQDLQAGRLTYGPTIGMSLEDHGLPIGTITPQAHVRGIWDFHDDVDMLTSTGAFDAVGDTGLNVGGGLDVALTNELSVSLGGDYSAYSTDLPDWSVRGGIGSSLSALGLSDISPAGQLKLDMGASEEALETKAKIAIPLSGGD